MKRSLVFCLSALLACSSVAMASVRMITINKHQSRPAE